MHIACLVLHATLVVAIHSLQHATCPALLSTHLSIPFTHPSKPIPSTTLLTSKPITRESLFLAPQLHLSAGQPSMTWLRFARFGPGSCGAGEPIFDQMHLDWTSARADRSKVCAIRRQFRGVRAVVKRIGSQKSSFLDLGLLGTERVR